MPIFYEVCGGMNASDSGLTLIPLIIFWDIIELPAILLLGFWFLMQAILFVDVACFTLGYLVETPRLGNVIRSVDPSWLGWAVTLACYPPFNAVTSRIVGSPVSDFPRFDDPTVHLALNLACAFASLGLKAGLLDCDVYGPSIPQMLGIHNLKPDSKDGKSMEPLEAYGVQAMSIGFLIDAETPMVWRGPMVTGAMQQLLKDTHWNDLDYLVIDMPPGTGDIQLTLAQQVPVTGAVIVTTPQDIALLDARKGLKMFEKVGIPILGLVENMSIHICTNCGHAEHIFGQGGAERMSADYDVPVLGALPLDIHIRQQTDGGKPTVVAEPNGQVAGMYRDIARKVAIAVADKAKDMTGKFPSIVVQNT